MFLCNMNTPSLQSVQFQCSDQSVAKFLGNTPQVFELIFAHNPQNGNLASTSFGKIDQIREIREN